MPYRIGDRNVLGELNLLYSVHRGVNFIYHGYRICTRGKIVITVGRAVDNGCFFCVRRHLHSVAGTVNERYAGTNVLGGRAACCGVGYNVTVFIVFNAS